MKCLTCTTNVAACVNSLPKKCTCASSACQTKAFAGSVWMRMRLSPCTAGFALMCCQRAMPARIKTNAVDTWSVHCAFLSFKSAFPREETSFITMSATSVNGTQ